MDSYMSLPRSKTYRNSISIEAQRVGSLGLVWPYGPTIRRDELFKAASISRSKGYELMKTDPDFPKGVPLYDSERSPKFYWSHEAIAWIEGRASKFRTQQEGN